MGHGTNGTLEIIVLVLDLPNNLKATQDCIKPGSKCPICPMSHIWDGAYFSATIGLITVKCSHFIRYFLLICNYRCRTICII